MAWGACLRNSGRTASRHVSTAAGPAAIHPEGRWPAAAARHPDGSRPRGADGRDARAGAYLRGGFSGFVVWVSAEAERDAGTGSAARAWCARRQPRAGRRHSRLLRTHRPARLLTLVGQRVSDRRVLKLLRQWLAAGVMEEGQWTRTMAGTPQGGVISPLLSNIYLHVLDRVWEDRCAHLGTLVRYADDFVVMCDTKAQVEEARATRARRAHATRARAASGEDEDGRPLAWVRGFRLPWVPPAQAHERPDLGADAATRLLPASVALLPRHAPGARSACGS